MRKPIALLASLIFVLHLTSCTSKDSKDESSGDEAVAESTEGTDADLEKLDAPAADSSVAASEGANEGFLDEQLPEDALGESTKSASAETPPPANAGNELDLNDSATPPPAVAEEPKKESAPAPAEPPPSESMASIDTGTPPAASEPPPPSEPLAMGTTSGEEKPPAESKPKSSLKKVESAPFTRNGILLNAVYIARPKDNYKKISSMIYGNNKKAKELQKANPGISSPHPGDKIYYNSPARATDDSKLLTFYEDSGMVPEVYVAKEGDDIKKIGKEVLGYDNGWKELWATNSVESKGALPAGTELRYWKSAPQPALPAKTDVAMNPPAGEPVPQTMPDMPPPPPAAEMAPPPAPPAEPPPAPPVAQNDLPPPPPPVEAAPPPPPAAELPPPPPAEAVNPPPPPVAKKAPSANAGMDTGMDNDMMMTLAGAGIILAGLAAVLIIRKRRQSRDMASAFNDTQVGT